MLLTLISFAVLSLLIGLRHGLDVGTLSRPADAAAVVVAAFIPVSQIPTGSVFLELPGTIIGHQSQSARHDEILLSPGLSFSILYLALRYHQ